MLQEYNTQAGRFGRLTPKHRNYGSARVTPLLDELATWPLSPSSTERLTHCAI